MNGSSLLGGGISIHALQAESDIIKWDGGWTFRKISIHALQAESDPNLSRSFLEQWDFNPRSPSGERRIFQFFSRYSRFISIHALQAESDLTGTYTTLSELIFQSTLSKRRATRSIEEWLQDWWYFNPRSPSGERLVFHKRPEHHLIYFNPRSPSGERHLRLLKMSLSLIFQSTLSKRRATRHQAQVRVLHLFQSTLSKRRATIFVSISVNNITDFNPRSPSGERR